MGEMDFHGRLRSLASLLACTLLLAGCTLPGPVVVQERPPPEWGELQRIALFSFSSGPALPLTAEASVVDAVVAIQEFVLEELRGKGLRVIGADELATALAAEGEETAYDMGIAARVAAEQFEATALLMGHVTRYEERIGSSRSASQPASVAFELTLRATPTGRVLWRGRFDERQHELSYRPVEASRLPGGGLRWITAEELARWGVGQTVSAMLGER
jgi:hypothetical protein